MPVKVKNSLIAGLIFVVVTAAAWTTTSPPVWGQRSWGLIYTFDGEAAGDVLGFSVSGAGDVDNDGYDDLIIGAPYNDAGGDRAGRAYVQSGKTGSLLWSFTGEAERDYFGSAVSRAGDVDNDGYDDFIVGAHGNGSEGWMTGKAYVYSGLTGGLLWAFTGEETENYFGWSVSGAGDVDNDGYDDLIVGAYGNEEGGWLAGKAYVYSGQTGGLLWTFTGTSNDALGASVSGAGDVDSDGYADVIVGAPTAATFDGRAYVYSGQTGAELHTFTGEAAWDYFGWSVSGAGDVNDDGYDDLIVGAYENDAGGTEAGRAYVFCGQSGDLLWTFTGEAAGDSLGYSVSGAGDVNDDGYDDLIVGAHGAAGDKGRAHIYSGQSGNLLQAFTGEATDDRFGKSVSGAGDVNKDGMPDVIVGAESHDAGGIDAGRAYVYSGVGYQSDCHDISPDAGVIIQHDQIGQTWYEFQQNGSVGRMISVTPGGYRHFSWMSTHGEFPPGPRHVYANCKDPAGQYAGTGDVDPETGADPGYSNQAHTTDGRSVVVYHRTQGVMPNPATYCMLGIETSVCSQDFDYLWDLPDSIADSPSGEKCMWPRLAVKYHGVEGKDMIHVVMAEALTSVGVPRMIAYQRCYQDESQPDLLVCETYLNGATQTYYLNANQTYSHPVNSIAEFDSACNQDPTVEVSPVSQKVAVAFVKPACDGTCDFLGDVAYVESMVNGDDWIDGSNYPPPDSNITNYGCGYLEEERAWSDLSACYDYKDSLHIVWSTVGFPAPGEWDPQVSKLYHWSKETGTVMIASAVWEGTNPGFRNANIAKMSISAMDPIHHPPDSTYLYCIWTQFNPDDNAFNRFSNGDIYGAGSRDAGATWGPSYNLTNTKTPNCLPGDCLSEHWPSLAQNLHDGKLHIQYVCDKDAGAAVVDDTEWTENPVMYLELETWDPGPFDPDTGVRVYTGESSGDWLGHSVSGAGDGDDDGYNDILVGAPYYNIGDGKAYVYSGRTGSLIKSVTGSATEHLGYCVSGAGRVNADNLDDMILGAPYYDASGADDGRAYAYRFDGGTALYTLTGEGPEDYFGWSVSGAGDVDNDGYDDLIVGAPQNDAAGYAAGRAYVYSGQDGGILYTLTAESEADGFGESVSGAGRVDDDDYDDFIVGAPDGGPDMAGRAYVYSGQTGDVLWTFDGETYNDNFGRSVSGTGDVDNDGYDDLIVGASGYDGAKGYQVGRAYVYSGQTGGLLYTFTGEADSSYFGRSVSGAGDVNDDGYDDLIVGAMGYDGLYHDAGRAYVYSGKSGTLLCTFDGEEAEDLFGISVSGVGDIDGDGYDEVIVGAPKNDAGGDNAGRAYVFPCEVEDSFVRGDANGDEVTNVGDIVYLVSYLYKSGPAPDPIWVGDCNCDEIVNVGDVVFLVSYLYKGGPEPVC